VASNTQVGQALAFKISGTGVLPDRGEGGSTGGEATAGGRDSRPGGGLGPPIDAPDPLEKHRWWILGVFAVVLVLGAIYVARRPRATTVAESAVSEIAVPAAPPVAKTAPTARPSLLLEALKEELFQLEVEHKQGRISQQEYEKAKAALDQTLERAVKREAAKA
jgi:hypothetical protein